MLLLDLLQLFEEAAAPVPAATSAGRGWGPAINTKEILLALWAAGEITDEELAELLG